MFTTSIASIALIASLLGQTGATAPVTPAQAPEIPTLTAERWIVYDANADIVLAEWNADVRGSMASVTKVMTAMVVLDNTDLGTLITIPDFVTNTRGSTASLVAGEQWSVGDLLLAMLVRSGNDAALTLAYNVGGESVSAFVELMNRRAVELGMMDTRFANPNGLDNDDLYSTPRDLLTMIIASQEYPDLRGKSRIFKNTNKLLGAYPGSLGLKTGDTPRAEKVLLGVTEQAGRRIYSVVMKSDDHFADTREIVEWAYSTYSIQDRWMRPLYAEEGGGATTQSLDISAGHERRLRSMTKLDDGRWRTSTLEDLPKADVIGRWIRGAIPGIASSDG